MVVLTLKNLQQQSFTVDIDLSCTVKEFKEKIEKEKGAEYPAGGQKLIYTGKILQDDSTLESYKIDPSKFLVIMVTKPKEPVPSSAPVDPTALAAQAVAAQEEEAAATSSPATSTTESLSTSSTTTTSSTLTTTSSSAATTPAVSTGSAESAESLIVTGEEFRRMVENIMEMGYEKPQVERALRASFNNPYTAVQYLVDGIPPNLDFGSQSSSAPATGGGGGGGAIQASEEGGEAEESSVNVQLSFLRNQPQFNQMRQVIRSNPQLLDAFMHQIGQTNPELLQVIQQNQEEFVRMLNEPSSQSGNTTSDSTTGSGGGGGGGTAPARGNQRLAPGQEAIVVSHQDRDAIERLKALGNFPEDVVIQAYFACEKNENLAAEFLFSQTWD